MKGILLFLLIVSVLLNSYLLLEKVNKPTYRLGTLSQDVEVQRFGENNMIFKLPKDLVVQDNSPRGLARIGEFEPYRFSIIISSSKTDIVNYLDGERKHRFGALYSIKQ